MSNLNNPKPIVNESLIYPKDIIALYESINKAYGKQSWQGKKMYELYKDKLNKYRNKVLGKLEGKKVSVKLELMFCTNGPEFKKDFVLATPVYINGINVQHMQIDWNSFKSLTQTSENTYEGIMLVYRYYRKHDNGLSYSIKSLITVDRVKPAKPIIKVIV